MSKYVLNELKKILLDKQNEELLKIVKNKRFAKEDKEYYLAALQILKERKINIPKESQFSATSEKLELNHILDIDVIGTPMFFSLATGAFITSLFPIVFYMIKKHYSIVSWQFVFYIASILLLLFFIGVARIISNDPPSSNWEDDLPEKTSPIGSGLLVITVLIVLSFLIKGKANIGQILSAYFETQNKTNDIKFVIELTHWFPLKYFFPAFFMQIKSAVIGIAFAAPLPFIYFSTKRFFQYLYQLICLRTAKIYFIESIKLLSIGIILPLGILMVSLAFFHKYFLEIITWVLKY